MIGRFTVKYFCVPLQYEKTSINTFLMFGFYVGKRVLQEVVARYGSCTLAKMLSFCLVETKFKRGEEDE